MRSIPPSTQAFHPAKPRRRWRSALLFLAVSATVVGLFGCDSPESVSDKQAEQTVQQANAARSPAEAEALYKQAAAIFGLSFPEAARTDGLYAHAVYVDAQNSIVAAQAREMEIARQLTAIDLNVNAIDRMQQAIAEKLQSNPQPVENQLMVEISLARGDAGPDGKIPEYWTPEKPVAVQPLPPAPAAPVLATPAPGGAPGQSNGNSGGGLLSHILGGFTHSAATPPPAPAPVITPAPPPPPVPTQTGPAPTVLHTLAFLDSRIVTLTSRIHQNQADSARLNQQKLAASEQADNLEQKSEGETGKTSVDDFDAGVKAQKKADDLAIRIETLANNLGNMQAQLAAAQSERQGVQTAIGGYQKRINQLTAQWNSAQDAVATLTQQINAFVNGPTADGQKPLTDQIADLTKLLRDVRKIRGDQAAPKLADAIAWNQRAAQMCSLYYSMAARQDSSHLSQVEQQELIQFKEAFNPATYLLAKCDSLLAAAQNAAAQTMTNMAVTRSLRRARSILGQMAPASLDDCLSLADPPTAKRSKRTDRTGNFSLAQLQDFADTQFKAALSEYEDFLRTQRVTNPAEPDPANQRQTAGLIGYMTALYSAKELSVAEGGKPIAGIAASDFQGLIDDQAQQIAQVDPSLIPPIPNSVVKPAALDLTAPPTPSAPPQPSNMDQEAP